MSKEYNKYLQEHKANVSAAYYWLKKNTPHLMVDELERQITSAHDQSKSDANEYNAYDNYFYGEDKLHDVELIYQKAWLTHIHNNPHHWQYWILNNYDPEEGEVIIDMPYNYIIEMICDWWSFSFKQNKLDEIFNWYDSHKKYMKLGVDTKTMVEYVLAEINKKLKEVE